MARGVRTFGLLQLVGVPAALREVDAAHQQDAVPGDRGDGPAADPRAGRGARGAVLHAGRPASPGPARPPHPGGAAATGELACGLSALQCSSSIGLSETNSIPLLLWRTPRIKLIELVL